MKPKLKRQHVTAKFDSQFDKPICGLDEVGRAPLAGPVVAACLFIPPVNEKQQVWRYIRDSKELKPEDRESLYTDIAGYSIHGIGAVEPEEIDQINIHYASLLAMQRAYEAMIKTLPDRPSELLALVDGKFAPSLPCKIQTVIKGDALSLRIGAASILAKVWRDRLMQKYHEVFPMYGWDRNVGYPTPAHRRAIEEHGICLHHRKSFAGCARQKAFPF